MFVFSTPNSQKLEHPKLFNIPKFKSCMIKDLKKKDAQIV